MSRTKNKSLIEYFGVLKDRFEENNITFNDINLNTDIPEEILQIYFSNENNVVRDLSTLFEFGKVKFNIVSRVFKVYMIFDDNQQIKITRVIEPKASVYYDRATQNYYRFEFKKKRLKSSTEINKNLIINEIDEKLEIYLKNERYHNKNT